MTNVTTGSAPLPKYRSPILVWLVWPIITLGIYTLVWYYKINRETRFNPATKVSPGVSVLAQTFGVFLLVPPFVSIYKTGTRIAAAQRAAGLAPTCNPIVGLVLSFLFSTFVLYYQTEMNKITQAYAGATEGQLVELRAA